MSSEKQIAANRLNGLKGGVKTEEGKAVSCMNALKHGLFAATLTEYDAPEVRTVAEELAQQLGPVGAVEEFLVEQLASTCLRLQRCARREQWHYAEWCETRFPAARIRADKELDTLGMHNFRLSNQFLKTLHDLERRRAARTQMNSQNEPNTPQSQSAEDIAERNKNRFRCAQSPITPIPPLGPAAPAPSAPPATPAPPSAGPQPAARAPRSSAAPVPPLRNIEGRTPHSFATEEGGRRRSLTSSFLFGGPVELHQDTPALQKPVSQPPTPAAASSLPTPKQDSQNEPNLSQPQSAQGVAEGKEDRSPRAQSPAPPNDPVVPAAPSVNPQSSVHASQSPVNNAPRSFAALDGAAHEA